MSTRSITTVVGSALLGAILLFSLILITSSSQELDKVYKGISGITGQSQVAALVSASTPALVQSKSVDAGSVQNSSIAFNSNTTTGNLILVALRKAAPQTCSISDTRGNSYTLATTMDQSDDHRDHLWYAKNIYGGATTITISCPQAGTTRVALHEFSGIDTGSPLDRVSTNMDSSGTSVTASAGNMTTTQANELVFGFCSVGNSSTFNPSSGYSLAQTVGGKIGTLYKTVSSTGTHTPSFSINPADVSVCIGATFKAAVIGVSSTDTTAPTISSIQTNSVTSSSVTIVWNTNEAATTQVEYGVTSAYGSNSNEVTSLTTPHSVTISGLASNTVYNFRVKSRDSASNLAISGNFTFTTSVPVIQTTIAPAIITPTITPTITPIINTVVQQNPIFTAAAAGGEGPLQITDFLNMDGGTIGNVVDYLTARATSVGTSGSWVNGPAYSAVTSHELKSVSIPARPSHGPIQIGSGVAISDTNTNRGFVQKVTSATRNEYIDYTLSNPRPLKVSVGMYIYFSGNGDGWNGTLSHYYDVLGLTGNGGDNYQVLSVQLSGGNDGTPLVFTNHTNIAPCNSGLEMFQGKVNQWYWVTALYDYSGTNQRATMEVYDANTWQRMGGNSCDLGAKSIDARPLNRISVGRYDNHGYPTLNSDYYMDDLMIDTADATFPLLPGVGVIIPPPVTTGAINCDLSTVQTAVTNASAGSTVTCNPGSWTWNGTLSINKGVILKGAANNGTVITSNTSGYLIAYNPSNYSSNTPFRVTGFVFDFAGSTGGGIDLGVPRNDPPFALQTNVRIDHNTFKNQKNWGGNGVIRDLNVMRGVVDNNIFDQDTYIVRVANPVSGFSNPLSFGAWWNYAADAAFHKLDFGQQNNSMYYEDNTINKVVDTAGTEHPVAGCQYSGRYIFRYNTITVTSDQYPLFDLHGNATAGGSDYSCFGTEMYGNKIINNNRDIRLIDQRGGRAMIFGNEVQTPSANINVRSEFSDSINPVTTINPLTGRPYVQHVTESYYWNNKAGGSAISVSEGLGNYNDQITPNVDYFSDTDASGVRIGTRAQRPATCTAGAGYWETNDSNPTSLSGKTGAGVGASAPTGSLYRCASNGTWPSTPFYTPLVYPHPLRVNCTLYPTLCDSGSTVVDTTPPSVSVEVSNSSVQVGVPITLSATASDTSGIAGVQFKRGTVNVGTEDTIAPYSVDWNTTGVTAGAYIINAIARDNAGLITTSAGVGVTLTPVGSLSCENTDLTNLNFHINNQINSRLTLSSPSTGLNIYTSRPTTAGASWTRNSNSWTQKGTQLDFTGVMGWNNDTPTHGDAYRGGATLITPRHFISAQHFLISPGSNVYFFDKDGKSVARKVVATRNIAGTDINVGLLDSDVDSSIAYYPLMSYSNVENYFLRDSTQSPYNVPIVTFNKEGQALVRKMSDDGPVNVSHRSYNGLEDALKAQYSADIVDGDSGQPGFVIINNTPILLFAHQAAGQSPSLGSNIAAINAAIAALGSSNGYTVTEYTPSGFTRYASTCTLPTATSGAVKIKLVGTDLVTSSAPANVASKIDTSAASVSNPNDVTGLFVASPHTVYGTDVVGYTETVAMCTYPVGGTECTLATPASYTTTGLTCAAGFCGIPVAVSANTVTKVVFKYDAVVVVATGDLRIRLVGSDLVTGSAPSGVQSKVDDGPKLSLTYFTVPGVSTGSHTVSFTDSPNYTESYATCTYPRGGTECALVLDTQYVTTDMTCATGLCSVPVTVIGATITKVVARYVAIVVANRTPTVTVGNDLTITLSATAALSATASDPDGTPLTYSWSKVSGPGTVTFSAGSAVTTTATFSTQGSYVLNLTVSDGTLSASDTVTVTVNPVVVTNVAPVLGPIGSKTVIENSLLAFTVAATDADRADRVTYSATGLPTGATFNQTTGVFSWTPTKSDVGARSITFTASDGNDATDAETVSITVQAAPIVTRVLRLQKTGTGQGTVASAPAGINCGTACLSETFLFEDGTQVKLSASAAPGSTFVGWTGGCVSTSVTCTTTLTAATTATVNFDLLPVNKIPVLNPIGTKSGVEANRLSFTVVATDEDQNDTLRYSATELPSGAEFNSITGVFTWTPNYIQSGKYSVTLSVSDAKGGTDSEIIEINISNTNQVATVDAGNNQRISLHLGVTLAGSATDLDGTPLSYVWTQISGPVAAVFSSNTISTPTVTFNNRPGTYVFRLTVTEDANAIIFDEVTIVVGAAVVITGADTDGDSIKDVSDECPNTPLALEKRINAVGCLVPRIKSGVTITDLTNVDLDQVESFELSAVAGKIAFMKTTETYALTKNNGTEQLDLDTTLNISAGKVSLDSDRVPALKNRPALITLYNITVDEPVILRDGVSCTICTLVSYSNNTLVFTVPGFSEYTVIENIPTPPVVAVVTPIVEESAAPRNSSGSRARDISGLLAVSTSTSVNIVTTFTRSLYQGLSGEDVRNLQIFLNTRGYAVSNTGPGSRGQESTFFGPATEAALKRFQCAESLTCSGTVTTTGYGGFGPRTRTLINSRLSGATVQSAPSAIPSTPVTTPSAPISGVSTPIPDFSTAGFTRDLALESVGEDVRQLQIYLNNKGFLIATTGTGSKGNESTYFGNLTQSALARFQASKNISPAEGYFGRVTRAYIRAGE